MLDELAAIRESQIAIHAELATLHDLLNRHDGGDHPMSTDPLAGILAEAEANRRRERAAQNSAVTVSTPAAIGDYTVDGSAPGSPVLLDDNGKIPQALTYPPSGGQVARSYEHDQTAAATVWQIPHQLGGYPPVVVLDSGGAVINGEVHYPDDNNVTVVFGHPQAGTAHLSL